MKRAAFILGSLLIAAPASAVPILPPAPAAGCVLEEITVDHHNPPDPGWAWLQQLLGLSDAEIEARKAADKLWEPAPEPPVYRTKCPGGCTHGGAGSTGGGGGSVAEPGFWSLLAFGSVGVWLRRRR